MPQDGEDADDDDDVVDQRGDGRRAHAEVLEAEGDPGEDADRAKDDQQQGLLGDLGADDRADVGLLAHLVDGTELVLEGEAQVGQRPLVGRPMTGRAGRADGRAAARERRRARRRAGDALGAARTVRSAGGGRPVHQMPTADDADGAADAAASRRRRRAGGDGEPRRRRAEALGLGDAGNSARPICSSG